MLGVVAPRPRGDPRASAAGFLLAEALVTLGLSALVLAALAAVLAVLLSAGERTAARAQSAEVAGRLSAALRRDLSHALPVRWAGKGAAFVFDGSPDRVLFAQERGGSLAAVELVADGTRLMRAEAPLAPAAASLADLALTPAEAFAGTAALSFRFAGVTEPGAPEAVADVWPSGKTMPTAVLVDVGGVASERITLGVDAEASCAAPSGPCSLRPPDAAADDTDDNAGDPAAEDGASAEPAADGDQQ